MGREQRNHRIRTTRIRRPIALGGRLRRNLARTPPLLPWARVTLPHMMRTRFKRFWPGTNVLLEEEASILSRVDSGMPFLEFELTSSPCTRRRNVCRDRNWFHGDCWHRPVWVELCSRVDYVYHVENRWRRLSHIDWKEIIELLHRRRERVRMRKRTGPSWCKHLEVSRLSSTVSLFDL